MKQYSELVNRYKQFRKINRKFNNILPRQLSKQAIEKCGQKLGVIKGNTLVLQDMDEVAVLMDYCIYDYCENGLNAVSRYMADSPPASNSDEYVVLKAMAESFYTLVQVEHVLPGVGVRADDLLGDKQFLIIDLGFSETAIEGIVLATRLLPFADFTMTSGAPLAVDPETLSEILDVTLQQFGAEDGEYINIDMQQKPDLTAAIIRLCLKNESSVHTKYRDVETEAVTPPLRSETRIGRNEPCPCGSGKKYKRCCGR